MSEAPSPSLNPDRNRELFIPILLGSIRRGRQSLRVARLVLARLARRERVATELLDLLEYNLPMMEERIRVRNDSPPAALALAERVNRADALVVVTPEYNGGYPGVLKNALDYLLPEYKRKPFGIVTVSAGGLGGVSCLAQLRLVTLGLGGFPIPAALAVSRVGEAVGEDGVPQDPALEKRADSFLDELVWFAEAIAERKARG